MGVFSVTFESAGTQSVTATDTVTSSITGEDSGVTVTPAAASQFVITGLSGGTAGVAQSVTVEAEDPYGNLVSGYTGTVQFTSTDPQAVLPSDYLEDSDEGVKDI